MENKNYVMQNYLRRFSSESDYENFSEGSMYSEPNVSTITSYWPPVVIYNGKMNLKGALKFVSFSNSVSTIKMVKVGSPNASGLLYSIDGSTWNTFDTNTEISLNSFGDYVLIKGYNNNFSRNENNYYGFKMTGVIAAFGDVTSLLNGNGGDVSLYGKNGCFSNLFYNCTSLIQAPNLPSTTLSQQCYSNMFYGCASLTKAPELPAMTLATNCYSGMFTNCTGLTQAPELPAMTLATGCYYGMFDGCTSLTKAPELPATSVAQSCYSSMFHSCAALTTPPSILPATTLANSCYSYMFAGCTSLTTAPTLSSLVLSNSCCSGMFQNCTSLTQAPELKSQSLSSYCYSYMFYGCSNLNYIKALFTTTPSDTYTGNWVTGVSATGTFVKSADATWNVTGINGIPTGWTVESYSPPAPK